MYKRVGVDGIKTGYLAVEKYSLASSMQRDERRLIAVASGFQTKNSRSSGSLKILSWGFRNTDTFKISKKNETVFAVKSWLWKKTDIQGITKEDIYLTLKKKEARNLKVFLKYKGPIRAPVSKNQEIANIEIYSKNDLVKKVPVYASEDIDKINVFKVYLCHWTIWFGEMYKKFFYCFWRNWRKWKILPTRILFNKLKKLTKNVILTREPGGTKAAEIIRKIILKDYFEKNKKIKFDKYTDTLLYLAARNEHLKNKIIPAIKSKKIIICDRFIDSTTLIKYMEKGIIKIY